MQLNKNLNKKLNNKFKIIKNKEFILTSSLYKLFLKHKEQDTLNYLDFCLDLWWANVTLCQNDNLQDLTRVGNEFNKFILNLPKNKYYDVYSSRPFGNTLLVTLVKYENNRNIKYYYAYHNLT
jgi:hypothetical protein